MCADHAPKSFQLAQPVICVVGPTASGKTTLAQMLAQQCSGEVVSADSMQVYSGMDIGTGKILPHEQVVPHYGIDLIDPGTPYSAALFQSYARSCFREIDEKQKRAVLCGGTGFYVRAAIDDYDFSQEESTDINLRKHYEDFLHDQGYQALWELLCARDQESAHIIPPADSKRVVRALELLEEGTTYATQRSKLATITQLVPAHFIGLSVDPAILNARIDARVDAMLEAGLVEEVKGLLEAGFREGITAPQAIGYKEIVSALDGDISLDEAIERIKIATHRYGKRQRTWFRKDKRINWISADSSDAESIKDAALNVLVTLDAKAS